MNPNENNPISPAGAGGAAAGATPFTASAMSGAASSESAGSAATTGGASTTVPSSGAAGTSSGVNTAVDFTNLGNESGLSMSDSLASAQDNLTSAGQAANTMSHTPALDQLGADKPAAEMASPSQPLTPAAPLPGSLGSVSSGAPVANTITTSNMPVMGGGAAAASNDASNTAAAGADTAAQPYFNPFASATAPTSATTASVPPALQPQAKSLKTTAQAGKSRGGVASLLAWIIAVVLAGTTVLFAILWQMAENKTPQEKIVYVDRPVSESTVARSVLRCEQSLGGSVDAGFDGMIDEVQEIVANYSGDELVDLTTTATYNFVDVDAATAAKPSIDMVATAVDLLMAEGVAGITSSGVSQIDNVITYGMAVTADVIRGGELTLAFELPMDENGDKVLRIEEMKAGLEGQGMVCEVE